MTAAQRITANRMIRDKGQEVTISGTASASYDPATGSVSTTGYAKTGKAVLLPVNPFRKVPGTDIKAGDEQMLLSALDSAGAELPEPPVNATVTLADGSTRTLIAVDTLRPAGLPILYDAVVRGNV